MDNWRSQVKYEVTSMHESNGVSGIYGLVDKRKNKIMYIGKSTNIGKRFKQHINPKSPAYNYKLYKWIEDLRIKFNEHPVLVVLSICNNEDMNDREIEFIHKARARGECEYNVSDGGNRRAGTNIQRSKEEDWIKIGRKLYEAHNILKDVQNMIYNKSTSRESDGLNRTISSIEKFIFFIQKHIHKHFPEWKKAYNSFEIFDKQAPEYEG